jgi:oligosaccharide reducing-end xylanase
MYPNPFGVLGKTDAQISDKITQTFNQLFHGDPNSQAIYFEIGTEQASIQDILHGSQVRTEGIGLAMMICVELDKRDEFDRLWNYATDLLEYKDGTRRGYFKSICDTAAGETEVCDDPYGEAQMTTALIFAHDRWGSTTGNINYETGAVSLLDVMRHKQDQNGGIVGGITNTFDEVTGLPFDMPVSWMAVARRGRPSIVMPAYYDLWARATGDAFWSRAAVAGREYWKKVAYPTTGLMPVRATFSGGMVPDWNTFMPEAYRAQINMALDFIWSLSGGEQWNRDEADNLITFFSNQGIDFYGTSYTLDGTPLNPVRDNALVAVNGITAGIATQINRSSFVNEVWGMATPTGLARYYDGILNLTALMILGGQYRVQ